MKKSVLIFLSIFMLASTISSAIAMDSDSDREEGVPHNNQRARVRENPHKKKHENIKKELDEAKLRLSRLERMQQALFVAESNKIENKRAYNVAKALTEKEGLISGGVVGFFSGLGCGVALPLLLLPDNKVEGIAPSTVGLCGFMIGHLASSGLYYIGRKDYYASLRAIQVADAEQKIKLKKRYHKKAFKANVFTSVITAVGFTAAAVGVGYMIASQPQQKARVASVATSFLNTLPHTVMGIAGLKWLTYTGMRGYKKWSRGNQQPQQAAVQA